MVLQAASAGIAVIASDAGGREAAMDQNGLLVPPGDAGALRPLSSACCPNLSGSQRLVLRGERMLASFSISAMAQGNLNAYRAVMAARAWAATLQRSLWAARRSTSAFSFADSAVWSLMLAHQRAHLVVDKLGNLAASDAGRKLRARVVANQVLSRGAHP